MSQSNISGPLNITGNISASGGTFTGNLAVTGKIIDGSSFNTMLMHYASVASDGAAGAATGANFRVPFAGTVVAAYVIPDSSQAGSGTNFRRIEVYRNLGLSSSAKAAVYTLSATAASIAALTPAAMTASTGSTLTAGDTLSVYFPAKNGNGIDLVAGAVQIDYRRSS